MNQLDILLLNYTMLSRTLSRQIVRVPLARHSPILFNISRAPVLTNHCFLRSYSLESSPSSVSSANADPVRFLNNKVEGKINHELLNKRIYQDARLPANQDEYDLYEDIYDVIIQRILPNIQEDGGNMEFRGFDFENGTVFVKLTGACTSCSMSETTLKHGIESMLTYFIPEVTGVKQVFDPEEEIAFKEFEKFEKNLKNKSN